MSILGTSVIAGVAQTGLQAQQAARQRNRTDTQAERDARQIHDKLEAHLQAVEEGDEPESPGQVRIDGQVPEHQGGSAGREDKRHAKPKPAIPNDAATGDGEKPAKITHVDLRA